jgi:tetratricopeptide (TPR) repeat protein
MVRALWLAGVLAAALPAWADPSSIEQSFERANAAFAAGEYEDAIRGYRAVAAEGGVSASLLYDLGNAELRAGHPGRAILAYERALLLEPRNPDIAANLRRARQVANLPEREPTPFEPVARMLTIDEWAFVGAAGLLLASLVACALMLLPRRAPARPRARWAPRLAVIVFVGASAIAWALGWTRLRQAEEAVIVAPDAVLRAAPYESASPSGDLLPGELVRVEREHESFRLIRTDKNKAGWVPSSVAPRILSETSDP